VAVVEVVFVTTVALVEVVAEDPHNEVMEVAAAVVDHQTHGVVAEEMMEETGEAAVVAAGEVVTTLGHGSNLPPVVVVANGEVVVAGKEITQAPVATMTSVETISRTTGAVQCEETHMEIAHNLTRVAVIQALEVAMVAWAAAIIGGSELHDHRFVATSCNTFSSSLF